MTMPGLPASAARYFPEAAPLAVDAGPPVLCIVVDAEEEFFWDSPFSRSGNRTYSIRHQDRAHAIFRAHDARPTYLLTYPLTTDPASVAVLRDYLAEGVCELGAQLHPWVTPPFLEGQTEVQSYAGNLPVSVEREKLARLIGAITEQFAVRPTAYKAGRYGFGPNTAMLLEQEGFLVDTSLIPRTSYAATGGPDFNDYDYAPFWFGRTRRILELPVTRALAGPLAARWPGLYAGASRPGLARLHAPGMLARSGLLERITLSPEGSDLAAMCRLTQALIARGQRVFTLSYHSPSLEPGNTPYVRNQADLAKFLDSLSGYLSFFRDEMGGSFATISGLHASLSQGTDPAPPPPPPRIVPPMGPGKRCLVVANTFPPVHGGSAVVYDSLARFGQGRVSVLAPRIDYRTDYPLRGWREFDRTAPFRIHRIARMRTKLAEEHPGPIRRILTALDEVAIRAAQLRDLRRIVAEDGIDVICIGEVVGSGWLARLCRPLLGRASIIYVHGEEISTRTGYDRDGRRRRRALAHADAIVAVSRFTREQLIATMGVDAARITLISNGVDLARFTPRLRRPDLIARYGLAGRRVLLTVGRLYERKGMDKVIEAMPAVLLATPDIVYLLVGDGAYRPALEARARALGLAEHVVFAGAVGDGDLVDHYALADVFIMANREMPDGDNEGFGLVFLEANACGVPVIAGKAGGSVDAVTDGVNGLVVDGTDPAAIAAAILRLFGDDDLRTRLAEQGRAVAGAAGWDRRVAAFLEVCDRISRG